MNYRIIVRTLGFILLFEAVFFLVPAITALCYQEEEIFDFLASMLLCAVLGGACMLVKPKSDSMYAKEGFVIVALSWIVMSLFGALPFWFSRAIPSYVDALFETVSGFTTTGATILPSGAAIEALPKSLLMWRSFTHWIGGMGVLVFIMVFLPLSGGRNINLLKAESTGASVSKLVPKMRSTARILYLIYTALTVLQFVLLVFDMPVFDAINTAFGTAGTGGFAIKGDSFASYSAYSQIVVTVFMILFSINFTSFYLILCGRLKEAFNTEVRTFLGIVFAAIALITVNLCLSQYGYSIGEAILHSAFSVASVISTTGYATANFDLWPAFSKTILVLLMFIGACAGSTGGGMKVSRVIVLFKGATHEMKRILHPRQVKKITMDKHVVEHEVVRGINGYFFAYILIYIVSLLIICLDGFDLVTNFTGVAATLNNIGPGLGAVGPDGNFAAFSDLSKLVFIFDMLAGRLEVFPMLVLFAPSTWRK
ncbi:MAG: TrkH family potassium uptake protein [Clostridia bacterium]|nr:TrkH family potassium uptake protein [Clostridia bacterium]